MPIDSRARKLYKLRFAKPFSFSSTVDSVEQLNRDEQEEKERLIQQLLELRNTLDGQ